MEAYDGVYELTLIVSDASLDNPIIWNFGKIEVKFKKPLDSSNIAQNYKNIQKDKLEPSFAPEESASKNLMVNIIKIFLVIVTFFNNCNSFTWLLLCIHK